MIKGLRTLRKIVVLTFSLWIGNIYASDCCLQPQRNPLTIFVDGLYWYTSETSDWAFTLTPSGNSLETKYKTFHFDCAPGARVGFNYLMRDSNFDVQAWFTHFKSQASGSATGSVTPGFLAARLSLLEPFSLGKATLDVCYNTLDWDLGLNLCKSKGLIFRPAIGLKGGLIEQKIRSKWERLLLGNLITASEDLKQNFKGIGPKGAMGMKWCFGKCGLNLIGKFDVSYLWGHWSIRDQYVDNLSTTISVKTSDRNFGSFVLHSLLGLEWEYACFDMRVGYEVENWFNQLQIFTDISGSQNNNLILQGAFFGLAYHF